MTIRINSENLNKKRKINLTALENVSRVALRMLAINNVEISMVFVSNQKIRFFNRVYLGRDISTDVIAWPSGEMLNGSRVPCRGGTELLGDIAVSTDKAARNAEIYGQTFILEVALYVIHGILHLAGYDDGTVADRATMRKKEDEILQKAAKYLE